MAVEWKGEGLGIRETRRHYTNYFKGIPHFKEYRMKLVTCDESALIFDTLKEIEDKFYDFEFA